MRNTRKSNTFQFEINASSRMPVPTTRYQGFSKLYQLNLSKMLLRCHESPFLQNDKSMHNSNNPQQTLIINTAQVPLILPDQRANSKQMVTNKSSFRTKKSIHSQKNQFERIFSNAKDQFNRGKKLEQNSSKEEKKERQNLLRQKIASQLYCDRPQKVLFMNNTHFEEFNQMANFNKSEKLPSENKVESLDDKLESRQTNNTETYSPLKKNSSKAPSHYEHKKMIQNKINLPNIRQKSEKWVNQVKNPETKQQPNKKTTPILNRDPQELKTIKSQSYAILEYPTGNLVLSYRGNNPLEIASLTKIMTFYCVRRVQKKFGLNIFQQNVTITDHAMQMGGTSAEIVTGEIYTIEQLLYGLMLPSGNDAAVALAIWGGNKLRQNDSSSDPKNDDQQPTDQGRLKKFIQEMNVVSKQLNLSQTRFGNPHGLPHIESRSSAVDVARITSECLADELFRKIVKTKEYRCSIQNAKNQKRPVEWINTNKLLRRPGFIGVKTGITVTAGPCLASAYEFRDKIYIIVILRSNKVSRRFKQTRKILAWSLTKMFAKSLTGEQQKKLKQLKRNNADLDSDYSEDEREFHYDKADEAQFKRRCSIISYEM